MSFTSHAQNFEDVMLWRALKHIEQGCYVDVGAQHPVIDSVSKAFYEHGWRGIHIEPVPDYAELLRMDRPDETVLQVALSDAEGTLDLYVIPGTGLSTAVEAYAQRHQAERQFERQRISVPVITLKSALQPFAGKQIHWLKIDVEGLEVQVLKGWDSQVSRPWVILVEATIPGSAETDYAAWDGILTAANYAFVYFDGLNRFYVAQEHLELSAAFHSPPNVFDEIKLTENSALCSELVSVHHARVQHLATQAEKRIAQAELHAAQATALAAQAEARAAQAEARTAQAEARAALAEARTAQAEAQVRHLLDSSSWRITAPLRRTTTLLRRSVQVLRKIRAVFAAGTLFSSINKRIKRLLPRPETSAPSPDHLSPRTARIYAELKKAVESKKRPGIPSNAGGADAHRH